MKLSPLIEACSQGLVDRRPLVEAILLAAVAGEHVLVIGPPGTAKSEAARRVSRALGGRYFEYLLGKFTEPSELFGPVDLRRLKEGVLETATAGMLPEAEVAFLDEIFAGSTAILNTLLGLLNERVFRRGTTVVQCPLRVCIGASNALPEEEHLAAFADRFLLRCYVEPVADPMLEALLEGGRRPADLTGHGLTLADVEALSQQARQVDLSAMRPLLANALRKLRREGLGLSDRRSVRVQNLIAAAAAIAGRSAASAADLWTLVLAMPTVEAQNAARACLKEELAESHNDSLVEAAEEASLGPLARARRLVQAGQALLNERPSVDEEVAVWELRLEGVLREIDATFAPDRLPAELAEVRGQLAAQVSHAQPSPELRPWEPYLEFLDPTLRAEVARLAGIVARHLGARASRRKDPGDPSGWSGLVNRGPYERLLLSEWALADEVPDEFLRRAAEQELLFWQPGREEGERSGTLRLFFDAGPDQLGACRVVQLALLVVFARRAQEQGCRLFWSVAQTVEVDLKAIETDLSARAIEAFVQARSAAPLSADALDIFLLDAQPHDELWLIGAPPGFPLPREVALVELEQTESSRVRLGSGKVSVDLDLTAPTIAQQLLRNPFKALNRSNVFKGESPGSHLSFVRNGRKLLARAGRYVVVYSVPNGPKELPGNTRRYFLEQTGPLLAYGEAHRTLMVVQQRPNGNWYAYRLNKADSRFRDQMEWPTPQAAHEGPPGYCWMDGSRFWLYLNFSLWTSKADSGGRYGPLECVLRSGPLLPRGPRSLIYGEDHELMGLDSGQLKVEANLSHLIDFEPQQVILCGAGNSNIACRTPQGSWKVRWGGKVFDLRVEGEVVGLMGNPGDILQPILVVRKEEEGQIIFAGDSWHRLLQFDSPLREVVVSPLTQVLAYRTESGEVGLYSPAHHHFLLKALP